MKMKFVFAAAVVLMGNVLMGNSAVAADVCSLQSVPLAPTESIGPAAIASYQARLASECALAQQYQAASQKARDKYGASLEQINLYQAMRMVSRLDYEAARLSGTPLPIQANVPVAALPPSFTVAEIQRFNGSAIKQATGVDVEWRKLSYEEAATAATKVSEVNQEYASFGFLEDGMASLYVNAGQNQILSIKKSADGVTDALYSADSASIDRHLTGLAEFLSTVTAQARQNQHMVWKERLMTPGEVAYFTQKFLNDVRPFYENNDRSSRQLQETLLTSFGLPHGATGDLMGGETLISHSDYYALAMQKNRELISSVERCLERVSQPAVEQPVEQPRRRSSKSEGRAPVVQAAPQPAPVQDFASLEYGCRILR